MLLAGETGDAFEMWIEGYQFPEASNPHQRFSWYMIGGRATTAEEEWTFRWQALTCDEPPRISAWLRRAASWTEGEAPDVPGRLTFTEPNLAFDTTTRIGNLARLEVALDYEFGPPTRTVGRRRPGREPGVVRIEVHGDDLRSAAEQLDEDIARYPDGSPPTG